MKKVTCFAVLALAMGGLLYADHAYQAISDVHDIMEVVQKPSMDALAAIAKAGGPQSEKDWKVSKRHASVLGESTQLLLMGGRVKDEAWTTGANRVIDAAKQAMSASDAHDVNAWKTAMGAMGRGCRGCHNVHKPKKEQAKANE